jgi:hypothetical protein
MSFLQPDLGARSRPIDQYDIWLGDARLFDFLLRNPQNVVWSERGAMQDSFGVVVAHLNIRGEEVNSCVNQDVAKASSPYGYQLTTDVRMRRTK